MTVRWKKASLAASLVLATILGVGLFAAWFFVFIMGDNVIRPFRTQDASRQIVFTRGGEALLKIYPAGYQSDVDPIYQTLEGRPYVPKEGNATRVDPRDLVDDYAQVIRPATDPDSAYRYLDRNNWSMRMLGISALSPTKTFWYLIYNLDHEGTAAFVGYDARTRRRMGYFGRRGFSTDPPSAADSFKVPFDLFVEGGWRAEYTKRGSEPNYDAALREDLFLVSDGELLRISLTDQTVEAIPLPGKVVSLGGYTPHAGAIPRHARPNAMVVRLPNELRLFSLQGEPLGAIPLKSELQDKSLMLYNLESGEFILEANAAGRGKAPPTITWFAADGKELRHVVADVFPRRPEQPWQDWVFLGILNVPGLYAIVMPVAAYFEVNRGAAPDMTTAFAQLLSRFWAPYTLLVLICLALAVRTYRRHARYESRGAAAWAIFVLLTGPFGLAAYLLHRPWPVRTACEHCGRPTPRNRSQCLVCAEPFPAPERRGIEIFA